MVKFYCFTVIFITSMKLKLLYHNHKVVSLRKLHFNSEMKRAIQIMNKNTELQTSSYTLIHVHVPFPGDGRHCRAVFGRSGAVGPGDSAAAPSGGNLQTLPLCSSLHLQWNIQIINLHRYVQYVSTYVFDFYQYHTQWHRTLCGVYAADLLGFPASTCSLSSARIQSVTCTAVWNSDTLDRADVSESRIGFW